MTAVRVERFRSAGDHRAVPRWAVWAAHAVPLCVLPSGLWRIGAWASLLPQMHRLGIFDVPLTVYIFALSVVSEALALLTLGLVRPWGEVFPRWLPWVGGRTVPLRFAVGLAGAGVSALTSLYLYGFLNQFVFHLHFDAAIGNPALDASLPDSGPWRWLLVASYAPLLAWPVLLAAVTLAYYRRRRDLARTP